VLSSRERDMRTAGSRGGGVLRIRLGSMIILIFSLSNVEI
jgi:hypothetical protein